MPTRNLSASCRKLCASNRRRMRRTRIYRRLLAAAETAPTAEKLEVDITRLRSQLADEKKKHASIAEQLAASQSAIEARDRTLGLTDLKAQIQRVIQEAESLAREEATVRDEMARLDERVASVQSKLLKLREREGKLWLIPDKSSTTKEPILAIISGSGAKLERFDHPDQAKEFNKTRREPVRFLPGGGQTSGSICRFSRQAVRHRTFRAPCEAGPRERF